MKAEFPKTVKVGQTKATIYFTPTNGSDSFTVAWYEGATRKRKAFNELSKATAHAQSMVNSLSRGESEVTRLSGEERLCYVRAKQSVAEFGLSLDSVAIEYRDAKRMLKGASLLDACRYYAAHRLMDLPAKTTGEVLAEMLKAKRDEGLSKRHLQDLDSRLGKFTKDFPGQLADVTGAQIKEWIQALKIANRTRNNFRLAVQTLFSYAKAQKYLSPDWNELASVPLWKTTAEEVEIFTPAEIAAMLSAAPDNMVPFLAIGAFAGLRSAEIERLDWSKVNLATGYITVDAGIAKTNSRRLIPITANLKAWLADYAKKTGPVVELSNIPNAIQRLVAGMTNFVWKHNALRHSFCSYRLAVTQSAAQVALEAGNSPQMIFKHYRELVTDADGKAWFSVSPVAAANVVQVAAEG